jgi:hypothetical protein
MGKQVRFVHVVFLTNDEVGRCAPLMDGRTIESHAYLFHNALTIRDDR